MTQLILNSTYETFIMVFGSIVVGSLVGVPIAILLNTTKPGGIRQHPWLYHTLGAAINATRSIPYVILVVLMMPFTRLFVGTSIGTWAALVPLSLAGSLLVARVVEDALDTVPKRLIEVGLALGAGNIQIVKRILLSEAMPTIISGMTTVVINIIGFSAMAGAVGGGGLGDLAIRYGYQRYDFELLLIIVIILVTFVQGVQMLGDYWSRRIRR